MATQQSLAQPTWLRRRFFNRFFKLKVLILIKVFLLISARLVKQNVTLNSTFLTSASEQLIFNRLNWIQFMFDLPLQI